MGRATYEKAVAPGHSPPSNRSTRLRAMEPCHQLGLRSNAVMASPQSDIKPLAARETVSAKSLISGSKPRWVAADKVDQGVQGWSRDRLHEPLCGAK